MHVAPHLIAMALVVVLLWSCRSPEGVLTLVILIWYWFTSSHQVVNKNGHQVVSKWSESGLKWFTNGHQVV